MTSESALIAELRLLSRGPVRLLRNNCGALQDAKGRWVHYGLGTGSSDLIGWTIRNGVAVFTAIEAKSARGRVTDEQEAFIHAVIAAGGIGGVVRSVAEARELFSL